MVWALLRESSGVWFGLGDAELSVTSVMTLVEEREAAARVQAEELRVEAERVLAELAEAEALLERRVIARAELAETLAGRDAMLEEGAAPVVEATTAAIAPVAGSVVPRWYAGATVLALSADYRRIVELVEAEPGAGEGISAKELAGRLGLAAVPAKTEGVRSKARRLAGRGWVTALPSGRFTPREPTVPARAGAGMPSGRGGGS
ncbi:hypothetical protein [Streptomyces hokutonensis]|uniref:Uncharacterized protein n=1 Tax=Streptomyces hokutonensis TaxID=1306990 RepID=A0ABW6ML69_9ACTN